MPRLVEERHFVVVEIEEELWKNLKNEAETLGYFLNLGNFYFIRHEEQSNFPNELEAKKMNLKSTAETLLQLTEWDK